MHRTPAEPNLPSGENLGVAAAAHNLVAATRNLAAANLNLVASLEVADALERKRRHDVRIDHVALVERGRSAFRIGRAASECKRFNERHAHRGEWASVEGEGVVYAPRDASAECDILLQELRRVLARTSLCIRHRSAFQRRVLDLLRRRLPREAGVMRPCLDGGDRQAYDFVLLTPADAKHEFGIADATAAPDDLVLRVTADDGDGPIPPDGDCHPGSPLLEWDIVAILGPRKEAPLASGATDFSARYWTDGSAPSSYSPHPPPLPQQTVLEWPPILPCGL